MDPKYPGAPPPSVYEYISDMLAELAEMAGRHGDPRLATSIRWAALDAMRKSGRPQEASPWRDPEAITKPS